MIPRALVVEDDRSWQQILNELLVDAGLEVHLVDDLQSAQQAISDQSHRLAIIDLSLAGADHNNQDGLRVMDYLRKHNPGCVMILLTGFATVEIAVTALVEKGAFTCLRKELFQRGEFKEIVQKALSLPVGKFPHVDENESDDLMKTSNATVLVVEDDAGWRELLNEILSDLGYRVRLCSSYGEATGFLRHEKCNVAVIDLSLRGKTTLSSRKDGEYTPDFEGFHLLSTFQSQKTPVIIVSGEATIQDIDFAYHEQEIFAFIEKQTFDRKNFTNILSQAVQSQENSTIIAKLTGRELEVLELLSQGKTNKEIAEYLYITPNTVKRHLKAIFEKLDIHTRSAAAVIGVNWLSPHREEG